MERLPKGHRVVCVFPNNGEYREWIEKEKNASYTEDGDKLYVECLISGDTDEHGISLISLDNPKWCLYNDEPHPSIREKQREKFWTGIEDYWLTANDGDGGIFGPTCPY